MTAKLNPRHLQPILEGGYNMYKKVLVPVDGSTGSILADKIMEFLKKTCLPNQKRTQEEKY